MDEDEAEHAPPVVDGGDHRALPPARRRAPNPMDWTPFVNDLLGPRGWDETWPEVLEQLPGRFRGLYLTRYGGDQARRGSALLRGLIAALRSAIAAEGAPFFSPRTARTQGCRLCFDIQCKVRARDFTPQKVAQLLWFVDMGR